jgi:hypothetical protein
LKWGLDSFATPSCLARRASQRALRANRQRPQIWHAGALLRIEIGRDLRESGRHLETMPPSPLPPRLRCDRSTVDLWWMDAREPGASEAALEACLASAERTKLAELRHPVVKRHRRFFRARLRQILSLYTGLRPESLQFVLGEHGKPALAHPGDPTFNLSHSGEFGLLGITGAARIGVDLELSSRRTAYLDLADRFFAPMEAAALRAGFPAPTREEPFLPVGCGKRRGSKPSAQV